ncbi:hypothetical protein B0H67DRAFT_681144 [Lasiosphaeris hirsuta]|uniref:FAD/NAD(P)-binding domain-containing protein n=1 Tax=Lasiosphaeris hirsuta TaxID=260670 RepID=A0AA40B1T6_9PEZI|nr:hypothetical protein B0H67DRAFT_681144 [Lasiosphaeris hirsuta]
MTTTGTAGIIGAGIAGLAAAIGLRRAGWDVEVFERSQFKNEIGAAISVPPNAARVLDHWGFDRERAGAVPNQASRFMRAADLGVMLETAYPDIEERMGAGSWSFHRVDLHRGLRELATGEGEGREVWVRLGCEVVGVDCEGGVVRLKGGEEVRKDLVVIADGSHSRLIEDFTGKPSELRRTGRSIYRWLVPMDDVVADADLGAQYQGPPGFVSWRDPAKDILWVSYTCRGGQMLNNACVHNTQAGEGDEDLWHSDVTKDKVLAMLDNFHATPRKIVQIASEDGIKVHHLFKRPPLTTFVRGRTAISAASLEVLFRGVDGADAGLVRDRLQRFDRLRIPRCNLTMLASNAGPLWLDVPGVEAEVRKFYAGPLPPPGSLPWGDQFREVLFNHDEFSAAEAILAEPPASQGQGAGT